MTWRSQSIMPWMIRTIKLRRMTRSTLLLRLLSRELSSSSLLPSKAFGSSPIFAAFAATALVAMLPCKTA